MMKPMTLRQHLEAVQREMHDWRLTEEDAYTFLWRVEAHVKAALEILDAAEHADLIISRHRGPWRLVRDPESSS